MANLIARIKLAPGEAGFYDEPNGIYLNWGHPVAGVAQGADLSGLRKAVRDRKIIVIEGTLGQSKTFKQVLMEAKSKRTGEPLEKLMGDTPLAFEPTELIEDDAPKTKEAPKKATTIEVKPDEEPAPKVDPGEEEAVKAAKVKVDAKLELEDVKAETPVTEEVPAEEEAPKKKTTSKKKASSKKADKEADVTTEE